MLKYPIPIKHNGVVYHGCNIKRPTPGTIADTKKIIDTGDKFSGIQTFIEGIVTDIYKDDDLITDRISIKSILKNIPYRSAEWMTIQAMLMLDSSDAIEGYYSCPRCQKVLICELKEENGETIYDTRDFISALLLNTTDFNEDIEISLSENVDIYLNDDLIDSVGNFTIENPTLKHCIAAYQKVGDKDELRLQFAIYVEALKKVNNKEIDNKWKTRHGKYLFENLKNFKTDFVNLTNKVNQYGLDKRLTKTCNQCGKEWQVVVNTSNFFDLGHLPM